MQKRNILLLISSLVVAAADSCLDKYGYRCCSTCTISYTDDTGNWGVENDEWCIVEDSCNKNALENDTDECWATSLGYSCCSEGADIILEDENGKWGLENDDWCGIIEKKSGSNDKNEDDCWSKSLGYSCCTSCEVSYEDTDGKWGYENDDWCGIVENKCTETKTTKTTKTEPNPTSTDPDNEEIPIVKSNSRITPVPGYFHVKGSEIVDENDEPVRIAGVNWFGTETAQLSPHGLWSKNLTEILYLIVDHGYNTIRYPYCNDIFKPGASTVSIEYYRNPWAKGLSPLEVMDVVIREATDLGLKIILDRHRPDFQAQSALWYTSAVSEEQWISDWQKLAKRYKDNSGVIGADLHNEPHDEACWGCDDVSIDWRLAAERCGNAIHEINPNWLIIVEGIHHIGETCWQCGDNYWWGGYLKKGVVDIINKPVNLKIPNRVVYSTHDYPREVFPQTWFDDPTFPDNMPDKWYNYWSWIKKDNIAPILVGEFGTKLEDDWDRVWLKTLVNYMKENRLHWTFWCLNENSSDTGGLITGGAWDGWHDEKDSMLEPIKAPDFRFHD
jgi:aryl-phospho-beta-D-glucosidase BglC (GH1 family)